MRRQNNSSWWRRYWPRSCGRHCAGFTLLEMSLVLLLSAGSLLIGCPKLWQPPVDQAERLAIEQFSRLYQNGMNRSLTHQKFTHIEFKNNQRRIILYDNIGPWRQSMKLPAGMTVTSNIGDTISFSKGTLNPARTIIFTGQQQQYKLTTQLLWGRLVVK